MRLIKSVFVLLLVMVVGAVITTVGLLAGTVPLPFTPQAMAAAAVSTPTLTP